MTTTQWRGDLHEGLAAFFTRVNHELPDAAEMAAEVVLADSEERVPKESGDLVGTGHVSRERGGNNTVGIEYGTPYARWIHEHIHFKHPHGGTAKFLELALIHKGHDAIVAAGRWLWRSE